MTSYLETKLAQWDEEQKDIRQWLNEDGNEPEAPTSFYMVTAYTVGSLMDTLELFPADAHVTFETYSSREDPPTLELVSWRNSPTSASLERFGEMVRNKPDFVTVEDFLVALRVQVGAIMAGYKGGHFVITEKTPVWAEFHSGANDGNELSGLSYDKERNLVVLNVRTRELY